MVPLRFKLPLWLNLFLYRIGIDSCDICLRVLFRKNGGIPWGNIHLCKGCDKALDDEYKKWMETLH